MKARPLFFLALLFLADTKSLHAQGAPSMTFTNPIGAAISDYFGYSVAAVGDKVLIGVLQGDISGTDAGEVCLFNTNGVLLNTITNPTPKPFEYFGNAMATMGTDRVLIAAWEDYDYPGFVHAGSVYLMSTNGDLLATFSNPTPESSDHFGNSIATVGTDKVLIGAYDDNTGASDAGAAYLFDAAGGLLITYTNPAPALIGHFGCAVAGLGADKVLVGAYHDGFPLIAGSVFLFDTSGALTFTFTNSSPTSLEQFGYAVAVVGTDKVLIGAPSHSTDGIVAGAAYLFNTAGALLTTFTNPAPANSDNFGNALVAVGTNKVLIGAYKDSPVEAAVGAAFLYSLNGTLLNTFTNPTPQDGDFFGYALAVMGTDKVIIGTPSDDARGIDAGTAYLYTLNVPLPDPSLRIFRTNTNVSVAWPAAYTDWTLQACSNLVTTNWTGVTNEVNVVGAEYQATFAPAADDKYFRLSKP